MSELNEAVRITIHGIGLVFLSLTTLAIMTYLLTLSTRGLNRTKDNSTIESIPSKPLDTSTFIETIAIAALAAASEFGNGPLILKTHSYHSNKWRDAGRRLQIQKDKKEFKSWQ